MLQTNKLKCLPLMNLSSQVLYLRVRLIRLFVDEHPSLFVQSFYGKEYAQIWHALC